jgi:hypothetical protein
VANKRQGNAWAHRGVIGGGRSAGGVAGERRRRHRGDTATAARSPAREQVGLGNVLHTGLLGALGKVLDGPPDLENRRRASSARAARRRPRELGLRRADVSAKLTRVRAGSIGVWGRARRTRTTS